MVALKDIAELDYAFAETFALVLGFYVIMFMFIEIPLLGYVVAPDEDGARDHDASTPGSTATPIASGSRVLALIGVYMIVRGILRIV